VTSLEVDVVELGTLEAVELLLFGRIGDALEQLGGIDRARRWKLKRGF
jgi:hypothetical protein